MDRFAAWLNPGNDRLGVDWQVTQGQYALGTGGFWGVGLGRVGRSGDLYLRPTPTSFFRSSAKNLGWLAPWRCLGCLGFWLSRSSDSVRAPTRLCTRGRGGCWLVDLAAGDFEYWCGPWSTAYHGSAATTCFLRWVITPSDFGRGWDASCLRPSRTGSPNRAASQVDGNFTATKIVDVCAPT